jgi:hypothetical protein
VRCGKPFGVKSTIERVAAKLEGKHWMFQAGSERLEALRMCADCRAIVVTESDFNPYGVPARPEARTTDDYLREREANRRAAKEKEAKEKEAKEREAKDEV